MIETKITRTVVNAGTFGKPNIWFLKGLPASGKSSVLASQLRKLLIIYAYGEAVGTFDLRVDASAPGTKTASSRFPRL